MQHYLNSESGRPVSEAVLARIIAMSSDAVICTDAAQRITFFNDGATSIFGYLPGEVLGKPLEMLLPARARATHAEHIRGFGSQSLAARPMGVRKEIRGRRKNGDEFPCEAAIAHAASPDGTIFSVVLRDVTERYHAEARQRIAAEAAEQFSASLDFHSLRKDLARLWIPRFALAAILEARSGDDLVQTLGIGPTDADAQVLTSLRVDASPEAHHVEPLSYSAHVMSFDERLMPDVDTEMLSLVRELEPTITVSVPLVARSKLVGWLRLFRRDAIENEDLMFVEQIGGRAAMAIENAHVYEELRRAVRERDETLTIVSHDLRNPVNAIRMLAGAVLSSDEGPPLSETASERLTIIRQAAGEIDRLIQDLLDARRAESGHLTFAFANIAAGTLIIESTTTLRTLVEARGLTLGIQLGDSLPDVMADSARVAQIMSNLVGNALKFTPKGGAVTVDVRLNGRDVEVTVTDTGPGIHGDHLEDVFGRFWQGSRTGGGVGLGLTIVRGIIEGHGGRVWVEPGRREGAAIHFTLPAARN